MNNKFEDLMAWLELSTKAVMLETITINDCELFKTNLPVPPQLYKALGYEVHSGVRLGIWRDDYKITVSNHWNTRTSSLPAWDFYENHAQIYPYFLWLRGKSYQLYGDELGNAAVHGLVLDDKCLYLASVKVIKQLLAHNPDYRPQWVKSATLEDFRNPEFAKRYEQWGESENPMFPKFNHECQVAIREMGAWLENRN